MQQGEKACFLCKPCNACKPWPLLASASGETLLLLVLQPVLVELAEPEMDALPVTEALEELLKEELREELPETLLLLL